MQQRCGHHTPSPAELSAKDTVGLPCHLPVQACDHTAPVLRFRDWFKRTASRLQPQSEAHGESGRGGSPAVQRLSPSYATCGHQQPFFRTPPAPGPHSLTSGNSGLFWSHASFLGVEGYDWNRQVNWSRLQSMIPKQNSITLSHTTKNDGKWKRKTTIYKSTRMGNRINLTKMGQSCKQKPRKARTGP